MTTQREAHGITFNQCPECGIPMGQRGMASHRKAAHGVAPATTGSGRKTPALDRAALAVLTEAAAGQTSEKRTAYKTTVKRLTRLGYLAADLNITDEGRARLA